MAEEFTLVPAKLREGKFVPVRNADNVTLTWAELRERLNPRRTRQGAMLLRNLKVGMFVGTRRRGDESITFLFDAAGRSPRVSQIIRQDPLFEDSLVEVFLVHKAQWDSSFAES